MKYKDALSLINDGEKKEKESGFMVSFERREGGMLHSDHFPDKHAGEKLIETEEEAWKLATSFANATDPKIYVNIYVTGADFVPVAFYASKTIRRY